MRILVVAALAIVAAIGGCDGDNGDKATPEAGWDSLECIKARTTLTALMRNCHLNKEGACEAVAQLQADINDNCR